jgi:radical SAM superfamily enzyme YgiQ (UPF0313 family)
MSYVSGSGPKALLIVPPVYDYALFDLFLRPYGLLRAGAWLQSAGYRIRFIDSLDPGSGEMAALTGRRPKRHSNGTGKFFRGPAELPEGVSAIPRRFSRYGLDAGLLRTAMEKGGRPDVVCIGSGMTYWYPGVAECARLASEIFPGVPVVVGGVYASLLPEHCGALPGVSLAVRGGLDSEAAAGPFGALLERHGLPVPTAAPPVEPMLHPALWRNGAAAVRLNRGCPCSCDYCASRLLEPVWRAGDAVGAVSFLERLHLEQGVRNFAFYDDALLVDKERLFLPFLEEVVRRLPGLSFWTPNALHLRLLDRETASLMRRAGFMEARFGFESDSEDFHREHGRKYRPADAQSAFQALGAAGFKREEVMLYVLGALPGQRYTELLSAVKAARGSGFSVQVAEYSPVPGSSMWEESVRLSPYPLEREPLYQNNSFMPLEWEGLSREQLDAAKRLARMK